MSVMASDAHCRSRRVDVASKAHQAEPIFILKKQKVPCNSTYPNDEVERDVCFESDLPRRLCTFLSITDPGAPGVIGGVFRKSNPAVINKILDNAGVGQIDCDFAALDEKLGGSETDSDVETLVEATSNVRLSSSSSSLRPHTPSGWATWRERQSGSEKAEKGTR